MAGYDFSRLKENLKKKGYMVRVFENKNEAAAYLCGQISGKIVGFGGSVTLQEMDLYPLLCENNTVFWHNRKPDHLSAQETIDRANRAEVYISSVNGFSETGEIVNIDNTGNRVAAISYGPAKVYLVAGVNKITPTLDEAVSRARNVAGPLNARRLNRATPCAVKADKCYDCQSPDRICRILSVLWEKPARADCEIILIDQPLGY